MWAVLRFLTVLPCADAEVEIVALSTCRAGRKEHTQCSQDPGLGLQWAGIQAWTWKKNDSWILLWLLISLSLSQVPAASVYLCPSLQISYIQVYLFCDPMNLTMDMFATICRSLTISIKGNKGQTNSTGSGEELENEANCHLWYFRL